MRHTLGAIFNHRMRDPLDVASGGTSGLRGVDRHARRAVRPAAHVCLRRGRDCRCIYSRRFFYLFTCEYCFSHYVAAGAIALTGFRLAPAGLARSRGCLAGRRMGGERLHESLRAAAAGHQTGTRRNRQRRASRGAAPSALMAASIPWRRLHERRVERRGRHPYVAIGSRPGSTNQGGPGKDGRPA